MLRDERLALLNDLLGLVRSLVRRYEAGAQCLADGDGAALLRRLAGQREGLGARLEFQVRALGDLPDGAGSEGEGAREITEQVRAPFSARGATPVLHARAADEERLAALAAAALEQPVPETLRELLRSARDGARETAARLRREAGGRRS